MLKLAYAVGAAALLSTAAVAQQAQQAQQPQAQQAKISDPHAKDPNKIVCQKEDTIGSRLAAKKVCLTQKEWDLRAQADREETQRVQQDTAVIPSG